MRKSLFIGGILLIVLVSSVIAADLSNFPAMFIEINTANVLVVVGKAAKAEDVLGAIGIVTMLQTEVGVSGRLDIAKLDSEVDDLEAQNTLIIGGPCANSVAAELMGYPKNCLKGFELGKGFIRIYEHDNGNIAILAAGTLALDTRRVTYVLTNYDDYDLSGKEVIISGVSLTDIIVNKID